MLIVSNDSEVVDRDLIGGVVACPSCQGALGGWGFARWRVVRDEGGAVRLRPRRARCRSCSKTHVLLPDVLLARRVDTVAVIGRALSLAGVGAGHRKVAEALRRPASTVRGWMRRFAAVASRAALFFLAWAAHLDPLAGGVEPAGSPVADALEAIGVAARAASLRLGPRPPWSWVSVLSVGQLLSNTSSPWLAP